MRAAAAETAVGPEVLEVHGCADLAEIALIRIRGKGGGVVETVDGLAPPLPRRKKWIINLSTQLGCPVGCPFCDAGGGFRGNLSEDEILFQLEWASSRHSGQAASCEKLKVHLSRMGEPSLNDAVLKVVERLPDMMRSRGLWCCLASVVPGGRETWFADLFRLKEKHFRGRFQLQFSVQSTDSGARSTLIPIRHLDLRGLAGLGEAFFREGDRSVVLNFALARGVPFDPHVIIERFDPERFAVKLTPVNPTERGRQSGFDTVLRSPEEAGLERAIQSLKRAGFVVVLSLGESREDLIGSNCGQLAAIVT